MSLQIKTYNCLIVTSKNTLKNLKSPKILQLHKLYNIAEHSKNPDQ